MADIRKLGTLGLGVITLWALSGTANAQVFKKNTTSIPQGSPNNNSATENVDFGDVDLDGDWDAVFADGGDNTNDQNRIWINKGYLQAGVLGTFVDETTTRFPVVIDDSRDIEFVDFDNDGDLDIYNSNTSNLNNQTNHWWTNNGGAQAGTLGFYTDETSIRWVGLGAAGSSIPVTSVLGPPFGGFIDWSCDCDFGDLDNDGDIDLFHSTYGGAFGGNVPSRIFLNNGSGFFSEFNPSGFQLVGTNIANGNPGVWAEGVHQTNTANTTGLQCDIASSALDIDLGDMDGDFDLDVLHGARQEFPRAFQNRLQENGGTLSFRDVTNLWFPAGWSTGTSHYEQEMGDLDKDGDLDIYGLNWLSGGFAFNDTTMRNNGSGIYSNIVTLAGSGSDDNEGDFLDYDRDGDLDLFVANFSAADRLYRNDLPLLGGNFSYTLIATAASGCIAEEASLDADCCDVDGDGDVDVFVAEDSNGDNKFMENLLQVTDTFAPRIPSVEALGNTTAGAASRVFRAQVYDNESYYITWYNPTVVEVTVNGCRLPDIKMQSSQGQIFRGLLPGNLVGSVSYKVRSTDKYGNSGVSGSTAYTATTGLAYTTTFGTGNAGALGIPTLNVVSVPFASTTLHFAGGNVLAGTPYFFYMTDMALGAPLTLPGLCNINIAGNIIFQKNGAADSSGCMVVSLPLSSTVPAGATAYAEVFTLDGVGGFLLGASAGVSFTTF